MPAPLYPPKPSRPELSRPELQRYSRQLLVPELAQTQEKLKAACVLVVGAGGLGCPVIAYLAGAGVGELRISDSDVVSVSNLHRQMLYTTADIGKSKAQCAATRVQQVNPYVRAQAYGALDIHNAAELLAGVSLVIDASDNFETRYLVHDLCSERGLSWVWGAASGLEGMCSTFDQHFGLRQAFPVPEGGFADAQDCNVTGVLGPLLGVVGSVMATEAIKVLSGLESLYLKLWCYDALSARTRLIRLKTGSEAQVSL